MRHVLANLLTYALIGGLIVGCGLFAWVRSEQLVVAREADVEPRAPVAIASVADFPWRDFGEDVYLANCSNCHTQDGSGRGMYPPVQDMAAHLTEAMGSRSGGPAAESGGRGYLIDLVLYGVYTGAYGAPMPEMPTLSDAEIAAVTNYMLTAFAAGGRTPDTSQLYLPREIGPRRGRDLSERGVAATRPAGVPSARELGRGVHVAIDTDTPAVPEGVDE